MTHPLASAHHLHPRMLTTPYAAVSVTRVAAKRLQVEPKAPVVAKATTKWIPFEPGRDLAVISAEGRDIPFLGDAYISADTFDPHHLVCDCTSPTTHDGNPRFA